MVSRNADRVKGLMADKIWVVLLTSMGLIAGIINGASMVCSL